MLTHSIPPILTYRNFVSVLKRTGSFWANIPQGDPDDILSLNEAFLACKNPQKVNLSIGAYRDKHGKAIVLKCVKTAEKILGTMNLNKEYLPALGSPEFRKLTAELIFGDNCEQLKNGLNATAQGLARTGSMRVAATFIQLFYPHSKVVYVPTPTWPNHIRILTQSRLNVERYKYYNTKTLKLDVAGFLEDIKTIPDKSILLLQGCAHNPTGIDPDAYEWDTLSKIMAPKKMLFLFDLNNQGFASGDLEKDAYAVRKFLKDGQNIIVAQSYSKNMALYGERIGSLTIFGKTKEEVDRINSQLKIIIRSMYSNPPLHGARIVVKILEDSGLKEMWVKECKEMAVRLQEVRKILVSKLYKQGSTRNWDHLTRQIGSFGFLGLNQTQINKLIKEHNIFLGQSGRISIGAINKKNVDYIAHAIHLITK